MAKKSLGYVHLEWECPNCGTLNVGTAEQCTNCQAPQPEDVTFQQTAVKQDVTDQKLIQRAQTGADVHCPYCGTRNPATAEQCSNCLGDLSDATARAKGRVLGQPPPKQASDITCEYCSSDNPASAKHCYNCGATLPRPKRTPPPRTHKQPLKAKNTSMNPIIIGIAVLALLCCGLFAFLSMRTEDVVGTVRSLSWERKILVETIGEAQYDDWQDEIPSSALTVGSCTERVRYTQDTPTNNSREVCGDPYTVDTGTGIGEIVQDCVYEVYDDWCTYTVEEWVSAPALTSSGAGYSAFWPEDNITSRTDTREAGTEEVYKVEFSTDGERYTYTTSNFNEYQTFSEGTEWILSVNTFGSVLEVEPAD